MSEQSQENAPIDGSESAPIIDRAFGAVNRATLLDRYFAEHGLPTATNAWQHVYSLLLWIDPTIGLAHCYESDKAQPGKPWYVRSLAFHQWLADQYGTTAVALGNSIDWLFTRANDDLSRAVDHVQHERDARAERQRRPFAVYEMPVPGYDPELVHVLQHELRDYLQPEVPDETWRRTVRRIRQHVGAENKRRNLVGEGFEDVLSSIIRRVVPEEILTIRPRALLGDIPGFARAVHRSGEKPNKVDLTILGEVGRSLVTVKWSIRADREKQFATEHESYVQARSDQTPFRYVLVTNEFDPARLMRAVEMSYGAGALFSRVVHLSPEAVAATYAADRRLEHSRARNETGSQRRVLNYINDGKITSLAAWLELLTAGQM